MSRMKLCRGPFRESKKNGEISSFFAYPLPPVLSVLSKRATYNGLS